MYLFPKTKYKNNFTSQSKAGCQRKVKETLIKAGYLITTKANIRK